MDATPTGRRGPRGRRVARRSAAILAVVAGLAAVSVQSASALTADEVMDRPGNIVWTSPMTITDDPLDGAPGAHPLTVSSTGLVVDALPRHYDLQTVHVTYELQRREDGSSELWDDVTLAPWISIDQVTPERTREQYGDAGYYTSDDKTVTLSYQERGIVPGWSITLPNVFAETGADYDYRVVATITWEDSRTGYPLASERVAPSTSGEISCRTQHDMCIPLAHGVHMGGAIPAI